MAKDSILDVKDILNEYSKDIQEAMIASADKVSKQAKMDLVNTSPVKTGKFKRSWRVQKDKNTYIVYSSNPGLAHLLEKPHLDRTGRKVIVPKSAGFIKKVEQARVKQYETEVENIIKNGG